METFWLREILMKSVSREKVGSYSFTWSHPSAAKMSSRIGSVSEDQGGVSDEILLSRMELTKQMQDIKSTAVRDQMQKAKIQWVLLIVSAFTYQSRALWLMENGLMSLILRFLSRLTADQISDLEKLVSSDEIRKAVWIVAKIIAWDRTVTLNSYRKYRDSIGPDIFLADPKIEKVQNRDFLPNRQILDVAVYYKNELLLLSVRHKKQQAMFSKFRWDYLDDVLFSFGFGVKWRSWIKGSLISGMASVLVNGSPTSEFQFHCGLKQGDPLAPYLFILVMESLHLSVSRTVEAGIFTGIKIDSALSISHLFYADDAVFIGEWTDSNLRSIIQMLHCFSLASGLKINLQKSNLLGVGVTGSLVNEAAASIGCSVMKAPFKYLGVMVGGNMSKINAWDDMVGKIKSRLSKWKINTLSIGGRLTLLKAVLGSTPIYPMSLYKVPKTVLHEMESLRRNFFNGVQGVDRKISWVKWTKVLASKKYGGLGVSSFYALNRALLFRWVWRFLSHDNSLWFRFISAMHGSSFQIRSSFHCSNWLSIIREVSALKLQGIDFLSHCKRRVGSGMQTRFWEDLWLGEVPFNELFPRLYALENNKECSVAVKMQGEIDSSFRRHVRGGVETQQLENIQDLVRSKVLSNVDDRWAWDLNGGGDFCVKDARDLVDEVLLPKENVATRWIKTIPIKVNVFAWKLHLDRLPTRSNLLKRGIQVQSSLCPICNVLQEDTSHLFFSCDVALAISRLICRWWNVSWSPVDSYSGWLEWFNSIRLGSKLKGILEGVFYVSWWCLWNFRNQLLFASKKPCKETLFDDVVSRSFIWSNSRCNLKFTWDCWLQHPYLIAL
ncbi:RNA-directed DNA polymerase, eukaryota [Tanacetum coccineum]